MNPPERLNILKHSQTEIAAANSFKGNSGGLISSHHSNSKKESEIKGTESSESSATISFIKVAHNLGLIS